MRVLFVSGELIAGDLCYRLKKEGCDVKLYIKDKSRKDCFDGMVDKVTDWEKELDWVGKKGLIVFDDIGYGKIQDKLRKEGHNVVGGSWGGDKLEKDREFAQVLFSTYGMSALKTLNFSSARKAIDFIKGNRCCWVMKQNGHYSSLSYVGKMKNGKDVQSLLESYSAGDEDLGEISLQRKVDGVEIAVGRFFNGTDWASPILVNIEHKPLFNGNIGPLTGEMGTIAWYDENENNKIFKETLSKLKEYLQKSNFKGYVDINCIATKNEIFPLEITARFGCPTNQLQSELHISPWKDFLMAIAKGEKYNFKYKKGYGSVVSVAIPPFPYKDSSYKFYLKGVRILFKKSLAKSEIDGLHFEEVCMKKTGKEEKYCIAGSNGYIVFVTGSGETLLEANQKAYGLVDKIAIPQMFYRTDIGEKFLKEDYKKLKSWGWI